MWWIFFCGGGCDVDAARSIGWRAEVGTYRQWQDASEGIGNTLYMGAEAPEYVVGYASRQDCMRAVHRVHSEGETSFVHWSWGPPSVRINTIHHPDYVEVQYARAPNDPADGRSHVWACFWRDAPAS